MKLNFYCLLVSVLIINTYYSQNTLFKEVSDSIGIDYIYPGNDFQMAGGGLMVIDVNNDGWEDFFQSGGVFDSKLWINDHGSFFDGTKLYGLESLKGYFIQGAFCADYNNDGYQDFVIANYGVGIGQGDKHYPIILKNIKGKKFKLISLEGVVEKGNYSSACWGDVNKDGYSDLYLCNYVSAMGGIIDSVGTEIGYDPICYENKLLINQKGKTFIESSKDYGVNDIGCGLASSFSDVDNDGDQDLLLLNDFGEWTHKGNVYYRNNFPQKSFTDVTLEKGFSKQMYGMGIGKGDYDQDGDLDYYITNIGRNYLYKNNMGSLIDVAQKKDIDLTYVYEKVLGTSWSGLFFDYEFDGDLDLYVSKGNVATLVPETTIKDPNVLFINQNGSFIDSSSSSGVNDFLSHRGSVIFDYDHDGDLDVFSSVVKLTWSAYEGENQKLKVYQNQSNTNNFIGIKMIGSKGINRDCFSCRALFDHNNKIMLKEVDGGSGQASQSSRILYFGLGASKKLNKLTTIWPNGTKNVFKDLEGGFIYEVSPNGKIKNRHYER